MRVALGGCLAGLCVWRGWHELSSGRAGWFLLWQGLALLLWCGVLLHAARDYNRHLQQGWLALSLLLGMCLPGAGVVLAAVLWCLPRTRFDMSFPGRDRSGDQRPQVASRSVNRRQALTLSSSLQVSDTSVGSLRALLESESSVRELQAFMRNPKADVYHLADAELSRWNAHFSTRIAAARERVTLTPESVEAQVELAESLQAYSESGLLSDTLSEHYFRLSLERWNELERMVGADARWVLARIDLLLRHKRPGEALAETEYARELFPALPQVQARELQLHYEAAMALNQSAWPGFLSNVESRAELDTTVLEGELRAAAEFWTQADEGPAPS